MMMRRRGNKERAYVVAYLESNIPIIVSTYFIIDKQLVTNIFYQDVVKGHVVLDHVL